MDHPHAIAGRVQFATPRRGLGVLHDRGAHLAGRPDRAGLGRAQPVARRAGPARASPTRACSSGPAGAEGPPRDDRDADTDLAPTPSAGCCTPSPPAPTTAVMSVRTEQHPNPDSRVTLSDDRDELGMRRVDVDWKVDRRGPRHAAPHRSRSSGGGSVPSAWPGSRSTRADGPSRAGRSRSATTTWARPACRDDPADGRGRRRRPDARGRQPLHRGSAVFPTSGMANPTLTIVALAHRLADHLRSGPEPMSHAAAPAPPPTSARSARRWPGATRASPRWSSCSASARCTRSPTWSSFPPWHIEDEPQHVDYVSKLVLDHRFPGLDDHLDPSIVRSTFDDRDWQAYGRRPARRAHRRVDGARRLLLRGVPPAGALPAGHPGAARVTTTDALLTALRAAHADRGGRRAGVRAGRAPGVAPVPRRAGGAGRARRRPGRGAAAGHRRVGRPLQHRHLRRAGRAGRRPRPAAVDRATDLGPGLAGGRRARARRAAPARPRVVVLVPLVGRRRRGGPPATSCASAASCRVLAPPAGRSVPGSCTCRPRPGASTAPARSSTTTAASSRRSGSATSSAACCRGATCPYGHWGLPAAVTLLVFVMLVGGLVLAGRAGRRVEARDRGGHARAAAPGHGGLVGDRAQHRVGPAAAAVLPGRDRHGHGRLGRHPAPGRRPTSRRWPSC